MVKTCKNGCKSVCCTREGKVQDYCPQCWNKRTKIKDKQEGMETFK